MHEVTGTTRTQCGNCLTVIKFANLEKVAYCTCRDMQVVRLSTEEVRVSSGIKNENVRIFNDYIYTK